MIIQVFAGESEEWVGEFDDEARTYTDATGTRPYTDAENAEADERAENMKGFSERYGTT